MAEIHNWTGLPAGVKFDPTDEEILKHLEAKVTGKDHPSIHEFIPTLEVEGENGICYTHPERLPGVSKDGQIRYFFHPLSKAYSTGTRKRGRICTDEEGSETRWRETGNTQPVLIGGTVKGFKKILVFDAHYQRHQYHLLCNNEEKDGELAVSKVFYLTQPQHYGSSMKDSIRRKTVIYSVLFVAASVSVKLGFDPNILLVVSFFCLSLLRIKNEGYNLGSGNQAGSFPQMDLPASASCRPKVRQAWGNDFTGNQNAVPRPAAQNQNSYSGQAPGNPETGVAAHPRNQNATLRPADQNQDPNYPRVGIGSLSMNPPVTIYSSSGTININNGITYNFSPPCIPRG